jgi:hypothetical protein
MLNRLRALSSSNETTYNGLPLNETLIDDGSGQLCMQEANALYNVSSLALLLRCKKRPGIACWRPMRHTLHAMHLAEIHVVQMPGSQAATHMRVSPT